MRMLQYLSNYDSAGKKQAKSRRHRHWQTGRVSSVPRKHFLVILRKRDDALPTLRCHRHSTRLRRKRENNLAKVSNLRKVLLYHLTRGEPGYLKNFACHLVLRLEFHRQPDSKNTCYLCRSRKTSVHSLFFKTAFSIIKRSISSTRRGALPESSLGPAGVISTSSSMRTPILLYAFGIPSFSHVAAER